MPSSKNSELDNDLEVQNTLHRNLNELVEDVCPQPSSPVLNRGLSNRKYLIGRRLKNKKSRVKLSDRFKEHDQNLKPSETKAVDVSALEFSEDSFSLSQNESLISQLAKLEELEEKRLEIYKALISNGNKGDFSFKKPLSVSIGKTKKAKAVEETQTSTNDEHIEKNCVSMPISEPVSLETVPLILKNSSNFMTATGRDIVVLEEDVRRCSRLFEDIITTSNQNCKVRKNKYAFLSKSKSNIAVSSIPKIDIKVSLSDSDVSGKSVPETGIENIFSVPVKGLKVTSSSETDSCKQKQTYSKTTLKKIENISLTQAISDSGISDTQILCAADKALNSAELIKKNIAQGFAGFNKVEIKEYENVFQNFIHVFKAFRDNKKCKKSIFSITHKRLSDVGVDQSSKVFNNKRVPGELPLPPTKRIKSVDSVRNDLVSANKENKNEFVEGVSYAGFSSASGKVISISEKYLQKARDIFADVDAKQCLKDVESDLGNKQRDNDSLDSFCKVGNREIPLTKTLHEKKNVFKGMGNISPENIARKMEPKKVFLDLGPSNLPNAVFGGFSSASGKSIPFSESSLKKAIQFFENETLETLKEQMSEKDDMSKPEISQKTFSKTKILETITEMVEDESAVTKKNVEITVLQAPAKNIFEDIDLTDIYEKFGNRDFGFQTCRRSLPKNNASKVRAMHSSNGKDKVVEHAAAIEEKVPARREDSRLKKRLGISSCKLLPISNQKLEKAKLLFEEDFSKFSPIRPKQDNVYVSTPVQQNTSSTPCKIDTRAPTTSRNCYSTPNAQKTSRDISSFMEGVAITPIKRNDTEDEKTVEYHGDVLIKSPTEGDMEEWLKKIEEDRRKLEERLAVVIERQRAVEKLGRKKPVAETRPRKGVLYLRKTTGNKVPLGCFVNDQKPGDEKADFDLLDINPENAEYVHFKDQSYAVLTTEDGATVVPNLNDVVGVAEIDAAFRAMPGVEPPLIPHGWVRNHYKWIVWKVACYERMFPSRFRGCLNVENVIQQLKYRYDREIDRAERSALRRIYEKDDAPQKRLVLCVSGIKKDNVNQLELELTDGWYRIRTVIDEPLRNQVSKRKIQLGTKLIISGAELLNCDGCYPLEATELTCLKINFNSTRRTHWDTKLGYQRNPKPFPIAIQCIHPLGGPVGAIKVCVVRTYSLKYMEKTEHGSVWRNKKAEERVAQQWEYERCKRLEQIQETVQNEFENSRRSRLGRQQNISGITSPTTLCEILQSGDPDSLQDLSSSQSAAVRDCWDNVLLKKQRTIEERINEGIRKSRLMKRDVSAVLKLLIVDVNGSSDRGFSFSVWQPGESLVHLLKEGAVLTVQNVLPQKNGDISSCSKTVFKPGSSAPHLYNDFKRRVTHIAELTQSNCSPIFNEFDTIGLVVQSKVEDARQEVWLSNKDGKLLMVNVYEGPSTCLLLDGFKRGQVTAVCNLVYRGVADNIARATANHYTVFSCYPRHKHLQEGLELLKRWLPKDTGALLKVCDTKIEVFRKRSSNSVSTLYASFEETDDDSTLVSSRLTSTDVALSLIDVDKFT